MTSKKDQATLAKALTEKQITVLVDSTGLTREEIEKNYEDFLIDCPDGVLTKERFIRIYKDLYPDGDPKNYCKYAFRVFDQNKSGKVEFEEFLVSLLVTQKRPEYQLALAFSFFDGNSDGLIDQKELSVAISAVYDLVGQKDRKGERDPKKLAAKIIATFDVNGDKKISKHEFIAGCKLNGNIGKMLAPNIQGMTDISSDHIHFRHGES